MFDSLPQRKALLAVSTRFHQAVKFNLNEINIKMATKANNWQHQENKPPKRSKSAVVSLPI